MSSEFLRGLLDLPRDEAKRRGEAMVTAIGAGNYRSAAGVVVDFSSLLEAATAGTVEFEPADDVSLARPSNGVRSTTVTVENTTSLAAARELVNAGHATAVLNFASATTPGGGFLSGARAQEEYLARSTGLFGTLRGRRMYDWHRGRQDPFYADFVTWSPDVPVLCGDDGKWLERPWTVSIVTSPAVHANGVRRYLASRVHEIEPRMRRRTKKVLAVAANEGATGLVLGAWGCGAFGNDGQMVAEIFREELQGEFAGAFERIVFAITDWSIDERYIGPFRAAWAQWR